MANKSRSNDTLAGRLATVETRVEALHHSVQSLTKSVETLSERLGRLGRMNWPLLVAGLGVLATWTCVVGYLGQMALAPVQGELRHLRETVDLKTKLAIYEARVGPDGPSGPRRGSRVPTPSGRRGPVEPTHIDRRHGGLDR